MVLRMTLHLPTVSDDVASDVAGIGRFAASRGWVPATSGNFSRRIDATHIAITRSGIDKGNIRPEHLIVVDLNAPLPAGVSAETPLHVARYAADAATGAIVHVHSVAATVLSRIDATHVAITRSGIDKGNIRPEDLIVVDLNAPLPAGVSAETPLHVARYAADAHTGAIVHVHSVAATVLSRIDAAKGAVELHGFEMHKSLNGITTHESSVRLPIFANDQDTAALATRIESALGAAAVPGYLLCGHGLYAWGATMDDARRHLEGLEFLLQCSLEERRIT